MRARARAEPEARLVRPCLAAMAGVLTVLAVSATSTPETGAAPPPRPAVKVGVSLALTGPDARWGVPMLRGVELGVEDVSRGGGLVLGTVVLDAGVSRGDTLSRQHAVTAHYERLIADPAVVAVIGPQSVEEYRWIAENFEPVGHIAYGHLIVQVTPEALRRVTDPLPPDSADKGR